MELKHDKMADAIYIKLSDKPYAYGRDLDDLRRVDYASYNTPIGVELLCVSEGVNLYGLPHKEEIAVILKRSGIRSYTMEEYPMEWKVVFNVDLPSSNIKEKEEVTA